MECQRERATEFKRIWNEVNEPVKSLVEMDDVLHRERIGEKISAKLSDLPDGAIVSDEEFNFLVQKGQILKWSFIGYQKSGSNQNFVVLTPRSVVKVLAYGFHIDLPT